MITQAKTSPKILDKGFNWHLPSKKWRFFLIAILVIAITFRFVNLDNKVFWLDETATIYKISGYAEEEWIGVKNELNDQIISLEDFWKSYSPNSQSNVTDPIKLLAIEDPKHTPLYFTMLRLWVDWLGNSATVMRSLSALISLLIFPFVYWLCLELFQSAIVGAISVSLIAVSPFHLLYAQELRPYSIFPITILLSSAALLRAIRLKTKASWTLYSLSWLLSIYTHTLSVFVFIAHGIYILGNYGIRRTKELTSYLITSLVSLLLFTPWLFFIVVNSNQVRESIEWQNQVRNFSDLLKSWIINLSRVFVDFNPISDTNSPSFQNPLSIALRWIILILVGYSIYFIYRHSSKGIWLFIITLVGIPTVALAIPDLVFGGFRSCVPRYLIAPYLGIHLAVAYLLGSKISSSNYSIWQQKFWEFAIVILISVGVFCCGVISPQPTWWNKYFFDEIPLSQISREINQGSYPLLVFESQSRNEILYVRPLLQSKVKLLQLGEAKNITITDDFTDIFLVNPSENLQDRLQKESKFKLNLIHQNNPKSWRKYSFWKLES